MLVEPDLDRPRLAAVLDEHHGLAVAALDFLPAGETSWCYRLTDGSGGRWFLKLGRPGAIEPARAELALDLAGALADQGLPVPRPRPTRSGQRCCWLDGLRVTVFELVDGDPLDDRALADPGTAGQVARLVAAVHAATPGVSVPAPAVERFEVAAEALHRRLAALDPGAGPSDEPVAAARALLRPQRGAVLALLERVQALAAAGARSSERVLCHRDLIGDNLLADRGGRLWLVDWDAAALAPREADLALFAGPGFERFLAAYEADAGPVDLDPDLAAFFLLRRNLDDLTDWLGAVLDRDLPELQRHADLDGIRWCLSQWPVLEARIAHTGRLLAGRRPAPDGQPR
jgi:spectinomycin phosphotransferase